MPSDSVARKIAHHQGMSEVPMTIRPAVLKNGCLIALVIISTIISGEGAGAIARGEDPVDFTDEVLPILRRHCFRCHGDKNQEAGLRLDVSAAVFGSSDSNEPIVVPQHPDQSLMMHRLTGNELGDQMPPDAPALLEADIRTLHRWIEQGAPWGGEEASTAHWAYRPILHQVPPKANATADALPPSSPIDAFVRDRLRDKGLQASRRAAPERLLRRVSLVLTGLPPTLEQLDAFLADPSPIAYRRFIDRILGSEQFGERWATPWLDLARYADSNGFQADQIRDNWAYRDWLIQALNADMPFDQFVVQQIAGDLLPDASIDQRIATGFHRMTTCNVEAGVHPEANRVNQVVDRVNTTATVFLGTTLECAQCHDHKYDPFSQEDYYKLFAYFNNTPLEVENTQGVTWDFYGPLLELPFTDQQSEQRMKLQSEVERLEGAIAASLSKQDRAFADWLAQLHNLDTALLSWQPAIPESFTASGGEAHQILEDGAVLLSGSIPNNSEYTFTFPITNSPITALRLEALTDKAIPGEGPGRGAPQRTNFVLNELTCELVDGDKILPIKLLNPQADFSQSGWDVSGAIDGEPKTGWAIAPRFGTSHWATFDLQHPIAITSNTARLRIKLDQRFGQGRVIGKPRISFFHGDPRHGCIDSKSTVTAEQLASLATKDIDPKVRAKLRSAFEASNPELQSLKEKRKGLIDELKSIQRNTTLVMKELDSPRDTFVMLRGDYESPGKRVGPDTPSVLPKLPETDRTGNRLELAHWLTSPENPLLARVTVNRWWSQIFGAGLVNTPEDFGTQAEPPSHPELLDWLAAELITSDWSTKHVLREIVLSDTFCQESAITPEQLSKDPLNRWLGRGPRFRLSAEQIRDNALAISGMRSNKMYGPPVMPHQPANLWRSIGRNQPTWTAADNEDRFRRGVYVIFKRASPYPSFINFDTPDRGSCTVQRSTTNTPLQALTLMNDPAYTELALAFADRILSAPKRDDDQRIKMAMRMTLSREPKAEEVSILKNLLSSERQLLASKPILINQRTSPPTAAIQIWSDDPAELAAWFTVASVLLNLDETINL
jgi:mono/diheme cytochrome c family protein